MKLFRNSFFKQSLVVYIPLSILLFACSRSDSTNWQAVQDKAFGYHDIQIGGIIGERIDLTIEGNVKKLKFDQDFVRPFREKTYPAPPGMRAIETGFLLESIARLAAYNHDTALLGLGNRMVTQLISFQEESGYLGTFPEERRGRKEPWDTEEIALMINGLLTFYELYGNVPALESAKKIAHYMMETFAFEGIPFIGPERALLRLSELTDDPVYLDFLLNNFMPGDSICAYWMDKSRLPKNDMKPVNQHLYRSMTVSHAMLGLYEKHENPVLLNLSQEMTRFLRTGGSLVAGIYGYAERACVTQQGRSAVFNPYLVPPLPTEMWHSGETCAHVWGMLLFEKIQELQQKEDNLDTWWMDAAERTLYNAYFAGQSPDGRRIRYGVETEGIRYWSHIETFCCPNNFRLGMGKLPKIMFTAGDNDLTVNFYSTATATFHLAGREVTVKEETKYPFEEEISFSIDPESPERFNIRFRIPVWAKGAQIKVNGETTEGFPMPGSYYEIEREWKEGDRIELHLPMEYQWVKGTLEQEGRAALLRGPLVFVLNPNRPGNEIPDYQEPDYDEMVITHAQDKEKYYRKLMETGFPEYEDDYELLRQVVIIPESLSEPVPDPARPGGFICTVKANVPGASDNPRTLTLSEFSDVGGRATHFLLAEEPKNLVNDPVFYARGEEEMLPPLVNKNPSDPGKPEF